MWGCSDVVPLVVDSSKWTCQAFMVNTILSSLWHGVTASLPK